MFIRIVADPAALIAESNESNNELLSPIHISESLLADLLVSSVQGVPQPDATGGIEIPLQATISNNGPSLAKAVRVSFMVSTDGGTSFGSIGNNVNAGDIPSGGSAVAARILKNALPGDLLIKVIADSTNAIRESDESNNERCFQSRYPSPFCQTLLRPILWRRQRRMDRASLM